MGEFRERHPYPGADPVRRLAHVLEIYEDIPDDTMAVTATNGLYGPGVITGLTYGDLRALSNRMFPVTPKTHYRYWMVQEPEGYIQFRTNNTTAQWLDSVEKVWVTCENVRNTADFTSNYPEAIEVVDTQGTTS